MTDFRRFLTDIKAEQFCLMKKCKVAGRVYLAFSHHFVRQFLRSIESPRRGKEFADFCYGATLVEVGARDDFMAFLSRGKLFVIVVCRYSILVGV